MNRIELLGVQIDNVTYDDVLERIQQMIAEGVPKQIVSPAIDQIIKARQDAEFNLVLSEAELVVADGVSVTMAARLHKTPLQQRVTGSDLVPKICEMAAQKGYSIFFMGGDEGVAQQVAEIMQSRFPGLQVAGTYSPPFGFEEDEVEESNIMALLRTSGADILFTALASPRQEKWIRRRKNQYDIPVSFGVGATFNFITGREIRAPKLLQTMGLEWLFRVMQRPVTVGKRILNGAPTYFLLLFDRLSYSRQKQAVRFMRPAILAGVDALLAPIIYMLSYWLYFRQWFPEQDPFPNIASVWDMPAYGELLYFLPFICLAAAGMSKLYQRNLYIQFSDQVWQCVKAGVFTVLLLTGFQFVFKGMFESIVGFSRVMFGLFGLLYGSALLLWRLVSKQAEHILHRNGLNLDRIVLVGDSEHSKQVIESIKSHPEWGLFLAGYIKPNEKEDAERLSLPYLGEIKDLEWLLPARKIDEVMITESDLPLEQTKQIVAYCKKNKVQVSMIPPMYSLLTNESVIKRVGNYQVVSLYHKA